MTRSLTFALTPTGDVHVFPFLDPDMPPAVNLVTVDVDTTHEELLIIRADRAGPLRELLGTGSVQPAPGPRGTTRLEGALALAEALADEIRREIEGDLDDENEEGFRI